MSVLVDVCCPTCFESFSIVSPAVDELPAELDYDCEICCRPMLIVVEVEDAAAEDEPVIATARSLDE